MVKSISLKVFVLTLVFVSFYVSLICQSHFTFDHHAVIRGDSTKKSIALIFTGDEFADGADHIISVLKEEKIKASFFFTGNFYNNPAFKSSIKKLKKQNHYLGAHSDKHLLYCDWDDRNKTLVSKDSFRRDLKENFIKMKKLGISKSDANYFIPPYEWYNDSIVSWTDQLGLKLFNFTSGTSSNADYTYPELGNQYKDSEFIYNKIIEFEKKYTLNGFILLIHFGTDPRRKDKLYRKLGDLIRYVKGKGYSFKKIDKLLD